MTTYERVSQHVFESRRDVLQRQKDQIANMRREQMMKILEFYCFMLNSQPMGSEKVA